MQELAGLQGMREAARALHAYTGRHMARLQRLLQASYLLDFTLDRLNVVVPLEVGLCCSQPTVLASGDLTHALMQVQDQESNPAASTPTQGVGSRLKSRVPMAASVPEAQPAAASHSVQPSLPEAAAEPATLPATAKPYAALKRKKQRLPGAACKAEAFRDNGIEV